MKSSKIVNKQSQHVVAPEKPTRKAQVRPGPEGGARQQNRKRRIHDLHRAALDLFLSRGLAVVTVEDLAAGGGLSKAGFYRYYASIEDLVAELMAPVRLAIEEASASAEEGLRAAKKSDQLVVVYMRFGLALTAVIASHQEIVRLYLQEVRGPAHGVRRSIVALADEVDAIVLRLTESAQSHGLLRAVDPLVSSQAVLGLMEHRIYRALRDGRLVQEAERLPALIALVLEGVARQSS